jgi:hypothetical protein
MTHQHHHGVVVACVQEWLSAHDAKTLKGFSLALYLDNLAASNALYATSGAALADGAAAFVRELGTAMEAPVPNAVSKGVHSLCVHVGGAVGFLAAYVVLCGADDILWCPVLCCRIVACPLWV